MKLKQGWKALGLLAVCALGFGLATPAQAQTNAGVVDEDVLADKYVAYKKALDDLDKKAKAIDRQLEARELLSPDEGKQFDEAILKSPRTTPEEGAFQTLVKTGTDRRAEYLALIAKPERNADEKAKVDKFLSYSKGNDTSLRALSDKLFGKIKDEQEETEKKYTDQANTVIGQVAKKKGLKMVIRKRALVWNEDSVDITNDVVEALNK